MNLRRVVAVVSLSLILACSLAGLSSCGNNDEEAITEAVAQELDSIKNQDEAFIETLSEDADVDELADYGIDSTEFMGSYLSGFDYTIDSVNVDGNNAEVIVTLTCKSFSSFEDALTEAIADIYDDEDIYTMSEEELNAYLGEIVMSSLDGVEVSETEPVTIYYTKTNNTWEPDESASNDVASALLSN